MSDRLSEALRKFSAPNPDYAGRQDAEAQALLGTKRTSPFSDEEIGNLTAALERATLAEREALSSGLLNVIAGVGTLIPPEGVIFVRNWLAQILGRGTRT